ncbi:MAG: hypothetical protein ACRENP_19580 [Longimicrobiales bacterium]
MKAKKDLLASPPDSAPAPMILSWEPVYAGISRAGDLGFTTGPTTRTERASGRKQPGWLSMSHARSTSATPTANTK